MPIDDRVLHNIGKIYENFWKLLKWKGLEPLSAGNLYTGMLAQYIPNTVWLCTVWNSYPSKYVLMLILFLEWSDKNYFYKTCSKYTHYWKTNSKYFRSSFEICVRHKTCWNVTARDEIPIHKMYNWFISHYIVMFVTLLMWDWTSKMGTHSAVSEAE